MRGCFVTGTDTNVGKTVLAGAILAALVARGVRVRALKPVITGLDEPPDPQWPPDHELLAAAARCTPGQVTAIGYGPAVSPHFAAALADRPIVPAELLQTARRAAEECDALIVEGVGGLLVPLATGYDVRAFARALGLPLVIAARPGLGTINHTLLTLEAARAAGLRVAGVVMTPWPADASPLERSNRETIGRLGEISVATLAPIDRGTPELLARAGAELPLDEWLS
jgi:dethiobiotin synthetase